MKPLWVRSELLLVRRVTWQGRERLQGCWLDWPAMAAWLTSSTRDLLPDATLRAAATKSNEEQSRTLATIPAVLVPGALPFITDEGLSPIQLALLVGWTCLLLAAAAVAALLFGVITLSERRSDFVSAVTHELRTPLTTFRMYAEMLADGMIGSEAQRQVYLNTLRVEADRLSHLVENVLAYARLERGSARGRTEWLGVEGLVERIETRLSDRTHQAGFELMNTIADAPEEVRNAEVFVDASAIEQVVFNLVDNACKYGSGSRGSGSKSSVDRIELQARRERDRLVIAVRDFGPGITEIEAKKLFRPFSKTAREAANSAPGVGLGLALSRRLAREMGGQLTLAAHPRAGACFELTLPCRTSSG